MLRELREADFGEVCKLLQDPAVMYAYEGPFTDREVHDWLEKQFVRYRRDGFGLWGVVLKDSARLIGQCGITWQAYNDRQVREVGYLLRRPFWHRGYATEAAVACRDFAFRTLGAEEVYSIIRDTNRASRRVAERTGMQLVDTFVKHYRGVAMPHVVYRLEKAAAAGAL